MDGNDLQDALEAAWRNRLGKKREAVSKATELRRLVAAICIQTRVPQNGLP